MKLFKNINLEIFRRKSSQRYIPEIDALRFFAILPVMLVHFSGALLAHNILFDRDLIDEENVLRQILIHGNSGVHLFFAISGFILTIPFIQKPRKQLKFKKYFQRRLIRIEPPYIIALTIFFIVHIILNEQNFVFLFERYIASFFYLNGFIFQEIPYILPVAWSLEIEIQFYLLMPLFLIILKIIDSEYWRYFIYFILLICSLNIDFFPGDDLNDFMIYFLAGIISADLYKNKKITASYFWDIIFVVSLITFFSIGSSLLRFVFLFFIIKSSLNLIFLKKIISNNVLTIIGGMCYTLYLLHYPLYHLLMKIFTNKLTFFTSFEMNVLFQGIIFVPISILMMAVYFILVEKPFMILSQKIGKTRNSQIKNSNLNLSNTK